MVGEVQAAKAAAATATTTTQDKWTVTRVGDDYCRVE
jgi:hypothetical protein